MGEELFAGWSRAGACHPWGAFMFTFSLTAAFPRCAVRFLPPVLLTVVCFSPRAHSGKEGAGRRFLLPMDSQWDCGGAWGLGQLYRCDERVTGEVRFLPFPLPFPG